MMSHQSSMASSKAKKLVLPSYAGATFVVICCVIWIEGLLRCSSHCIRVLLIPSICVDNVEVIIVIAMACHIGLYLELTFNEGSLLRYHLKIGTSIDQLGRLPKTASHFFDSRRSVQCPQDYSISLLSLDQRM